MRTCGWLISLWGCGSDDVMLGVVVRDGSGVAGVTVEGLGRTTKTDLTGRFELDPGGLAVPVTAVPEPTRAVSELSCGARPWIDLSSPPARATATLALILRDVAPESGLRVAFATLEGPHRSPTSRSWDLEAPTFAQEEGRVGVWTASLQVPVARAWALGVTTLSPRPGGAGRVVTQAMLATGSALGPGEIRYLDVFMSDETLRDPVYWDAAGVEGVETVTVLQRVQVGELQLDLPIWHGRIDQPVALPVVLLDEHDPLLDLQVVLAWPGTPTCGGRTTGVLATIERGVISGRWVEGADAGQQVSVPLLQVPEAWPEPPSLELGAGDRPQLAWSFVPDRDADLTFDLRAGRVQWNALGRSGCADSAVDWPQALEPLGSRRLSGTLRWATEDAWGICTLR